MASYPITAKAEAQHINTFLTSVRVRARDGTETKRNPLEHYQS